ncbi:MarR family transcriptional regulator [Arthrobacter sp. FW306-07-I]|uniref:MarR family transcriptional regulator n=1 Tax=Arthrobacter sp. FW306-07-I TaxID=2879622 RepID=UPI001F1FF3C4|nr:MarR family transcriptional regulator [Arthrobacter sp. FW306-07-I]UKA76838.1 MarR family transcriptional regulator [Arthrobacter sp. FW306-07-I]
MFVMTIDQRGSTGGQDLVPDLLARIAALQPSGTEQTVFERTVGDEVQGVVPNPSVVVEIALHALRFGRWYVGIGVGTVSLAPGASPRQGTGTAFVAARKAVELAKAAGPQVPLSVVPGIMAKTGGVPAGEGSQACANAEAVLRLLGRLVQDRTEAQWRVVDALRRLDEGRLDGSRLGARSPGPGRHGSQKQVALELGISEQSVSRTVLRSGWQEEWAARPAAAMLLGFANSQINGPLKDDRDADDPNEGDR